MYKKSYKDILYNREYSQYFIITKWSMTFKNCESLYCTPITYIILYINYTSVKKKGKYLEVNNSALYTMTKIFKKHTWKPPLASSLEAEMKGGQRWNEGEASTCSPFQFPSGQSDWTGVLCHLHATSRAGGLMRYPVLSAAKWAPKSAAAKMDKHVFLLISSINE